MWLLKLMGSFMNQNSLILESVTIPFTQPEGTSNLDKNNFCIFILIICANYSIR